MWLSKYNFLPSPLFETKEEFFLKRRLLTLMAGRLLFSTLLMGTTVFYQLREIEQVAHPSKNFVFWLIGSIYFVTLIYSLIFPRIRFFRKFLSVQLGGDLLIFSLLILATGCQDSLFLFSYLFVIIGAAIFLGRRDTLLFAAHSFIYFSIIMVGNFLQFFYHLPFIKLPFSIELLQLFYILLIYGTSFFVVALLSSFLVEQLRYSEEIIEQQRVDMDNLEALQRDIVMSLNSGLITTDLDGSIRFFNPRATELTQLSWPHDLSSSILNIFTDIDITKLETIPRRCELSFSRHDEKEHIILGLSISFLKDRQNNMNGLLFLFQDLTQLKEIQEVALRNEKLAAIGELAAGLAHEIRNPLSSLSGSIQMLRSDLDLSGEEQTLMDISLKEVDRLNKLLSDFLLFARPSELIKEFCDVGDLLYETLFLFKQDNRYRMISVEVKVSDKCPIEVDKKQFQQVLWNLLVNAAQSMKIEGGKIFLGGTFDGHQTKICVADEGPGIPSEIQQQIFDPFFSTKARGTGLGLSVVQRVISEHKGKIKIRQNSKGMNCFELFFPFHSDSNQHLE